MLSGTPTAAGTASFTVNVTDTAGATLSQELHADGQSWHWHRPRNAGGGHAGTVTSQTITVSGGASPTPPSASPASVPARTGLTAGEL